MWVSGDFIAALFGADVAAVSRMADPHGAQEGTVNTARDRVTWRAGEQP